MNYGGFGTVEVFVKNKFIYISVILVAVILYIFENGIFEMIKYWGREEYSHGYMIPLVSAFLVLQKSDQLVLCSRSSSWLGFILVLFGLLAYVSGEIATVYEVVQYGFILCVAGVFLSYWGLKATLLIWGAFVYLVFMVPLPDFLFSALSAKLQLWSSMLGVAVIRLLNISVYLEGNIIDLGIYKLQVVEACSGLRYLFPLMSFGFLVAYLFEAPLWQRFIIFISSIPITILMNSLRIALIGVTVEYWGIDMAEGVLHDFEGWVVFMACIGILAIEMAILNKVFLGGGSLFSRINLDIPSGFPLANIKRDQPRPMTPFWASVFLVLIVAILKPYLDVRNEVVKTRESFNTFPMLYKSWIGRESVIEDNLLDALKLTDYVMANYTNPDWKAPTNLYIAYYSSQRQGAAIHSPRTCMPGGGWKIQDLKQIEIPSVTSMEGRPLRVNRTYITEGDDAQIVYYWFEQRGRNITNEFEAKWYIFIDALFEQRTDGALVRVIVPIERGKSAQEADLQAISFIRDFYEMIPRYVPGLFVDGNK